MNSMWSDGANDRDWAGGSDDEPVELCPHGKASGCDSCLVVFLEWAREQNRKAALAAFFGGTKKPAAVSVPTRDEEKA